MLRRQRQNNGKVEGILVYIGSPCSKHKYTFKTAKPPQEQNNIKSIYGKSVRLRDYLKRQSQPTESKISKSWKVVYSRVPWLDYMSKTE